MKLKVGDQFPNMTVSTAYKTETVRELVTEKTVFWVLRYVGCTVCRVDIRALKQHYSQFEAKGTKVVVVLQSDAQHIRKDLEEHALPFEVLSDPEMKFYKELEIAPAKNKLALAGNVFKMKGKLDAAKKAGFVHGDYEGDELQLPALFIVDKDLKVTYAHYAKSLSDMPSVDEVLALL